ncbi:MAG: peroxiredoxin [Candidatus Acidiferrales bacterium]
MMISRYGAARAAKLSVLCSALLLFTFAVVRADDQPAATQPPAEGTKAPEFTLNSQDGTPISLHEFRGKWVVLYFYPKDFTTGCTIEAHSFQTDLAQYQKINAVILGVSVDSADSHKDFCAKEGLNFKLLADTAHEVSGKYGSLRTYGANTMAARNTFIINPDGVIVKEFIGVNPTGHSQQVLAALADLQKTASVYDPLGASRSPVE